MGLSHKYQSLHNIIQQQKNCTANVFAQTPLNIYFRKALIANKWAQCLNLVERVMVVPLSKNKMFLFGS
jgi:hypothetical protein